MELVTDVHNIRLAPDMGKWNWGFGPPPFGLHYARHLFRDGQAKGNERLRLMQPEAAGRRWDHTQAWPNQLAEEDHHTTWIADRTIDFLAGAGDEPTFCWASFADPYHPFDPPAPWSDRYTADDMGEALPVVHPGDLDGKPAFHQSWSDGFRGTLFEWANPGWAKLDDAQRRSVLAGYYGMVAHIDHHVGRILDALAASGRAEDTLVIFSADHGDYLGDHELMLKGPIHYESLVRVPLIVRGPGFAAGATHDDPVGTIDLAPTVLDAVGHPAATFHEGRSLQGQLTNPREEVLTEDDMVEGFLQSRTLTTKRFRLTRDLVTDANGELYDLDDDPGELTNRWGDPALAAEQADLLAHLHAVMRHDRGRIVPQVCEAG